MTSNGVRSRLEGRGIVDAVCLFSLLVALLVGACSRSPAIEQLKIHVSTDAAYRVAYESLAEAGIAGQPSSNRLALTHRGAPVPIWVEDGDDGKFGPGDHFEFLGEHPSGPTSTFDEYARFNVYRLSMNEPGGARMTAASTTSRAAPGGALRALRHVEYDELMVRFRGSKAAAEAPELWFWHRLNHSDKQAFEVELPLHGLPVEGEDRSEAVSVRLQFRGWSGAATPRGQVPRNPPDHEIKVWLNSTLIATETWWGQDKHEIEIPSLPAGTLGRLRNVLRIRVPPRQNAAGKTMIDAILLNWLEIEHPHSGVLEAGQDQLAWSGSEEPRTALITTDGPSEVLIYGSDGSRQQASVDPGTPLAVTLPARAGTLHAVVGTSLAVPAAVTGDRPSSLRANSRQADYLMIANGHLLEAAERLADHHRQRGLRVEVIDVEDIYDELNHGIVHPRAIRDLIDHAYHHWPAPAPRFVLLMGDASWDIRSQEPDDKRYADWTFRGRNRSDFIKNKSTEYDSENVLRDLVPTWRYESAQGHAASDNYFVAIEGEDFHPDLAIGRLPAVSSTEAQAMVDKIIRYSQITEVGPWRRRILWITNEQDGFKRRTDRLAMSAAQAGYLALKVYPSPEETDNVHHQSRLRSAFDQGQLLVHFLGHGGRYIWRTGPPDFRKNHDLFTLEDLDQLAPTSRLPMVLAMSCYSAPFDHPTADSIGEKFIRMPERGAIAVLAASWRNSPSVRFSQVVLDGLFAGQAVGEAVRQAKLSTASRTMIETYNLLGDPATRLALPELPLTVETERTAEGWDLSVAVDPEGEVARSFEGQGIVDWIATDGEVLRSTAAVVEHGRLAGQFAVSEAAPSPVIVRVYVWNEKRGLDGVGGAALEEPAKNRPAEKVADL